MVSNFARNVGYEYVNFLTLSAPQAYVKNRDFILVRPSLSNDPSLFIIVSWRFLWRSASSWEGSHSRGQPEVFFMPRG